MSKLQHGALRRKKNLLLGTILGIITIVGVGAFLALKTVQENFQSTIQNEFGLKSILHELRVEMLEMNRNKRDYLLQADSFSEELHSESMEKIEKLSHSISYARQDGQLKILLQEFDQNIDLYKYRLCKLQPAAGPKSAKL
ncbi:MAG TPA: hypothetical protein VE954_31660 [Oligoflexus sp.]|uniref:hypothetical protein n=1 Tax=Oligoflexus sp. TaxID=1971216 RepID=UPI002D69435A|nr:hypothetical protein [Oligoflexus sp.]HYX37682.1 hypothetical protein [Oligoflexus sp.]